MAGGAHAEHAPRQQHLIRIAVEAEVTLVDAPDDIPETGDDAAMTA